MVSISQELFEKLQIDLDDVPLEYLADYTAIAYFLTMEEPPPDSASNLDKVRIYLGFAEKVSQKIRRPKASNYPLN